MKKLIVTLLTLSVLTSSIAYAAPKTNTAASPAPTSQEANEAQTAADGENDLPDPSPDPSESPAPSESASPSPATAPPVTPRPSEKELSTEFVLNIEVMPRKHIMSKNAVIELYDMNDNLLGSQLRYVGWDTPSVTMKFKVPEYRMGTKFKVKLVEGLRSIWYYGKGVQPGDYLEVETYGYLGEDGSYVQNNGASIDAKPHYDKEVHLYITNKWYNDITPHARIVDDVLMVPVRAVAEAMDLDVTYNPEWHSVTLSLEDQAVCFWANNDYMTYPEGDKNAQHKPVYIEGSLFVPVRDLAEAYGCSLEVTDYGEFMDILIGEAPYHKTIMERIPVNRDGIGSRTNYLVWVSKHEYKVRVYEGQQYHWKLLKEFPCALGAWNTPTITGQYEIIERTQWNYDGYYVGPVLRFHNGYALHSTLLYYGGGEYDGRVGVNISHGCVRLHPEDINWIAATVPFRTRVYLTE